jgi:hypothetical protein
MVAAPELTIFDKRVTDHTVGGDGIMGNLAGVYLTS